MMTVMLDSNLTGEAKRKRLEKLSSQVGSYGRDYNVDMQELVLPDILRASLNTMMKRS